MKFNFTLGAGSQIVLLGRQSVPPSLYVHDFYKPLKGSTTIPTHTVEHHPRRKRQALEIVEPRSAVAEEFLLDGRWYLMLINDRNRVCLVYLPRKILILAGTDLSSNHSSGNPKTVRKSLGSKM